MPISLVMLITVLLAMLIAVCLVRLLYAFNKTLGYRLFAAPIPFCDRRACEEKRLADKNIEFDVSARSV